MGKKNDVIVARRFDESMITDETTVLADLFTRILLTDDDVEIARGVLASPVVAAVCRRVTGRFGAAALIVSSGELPDIRRETYGVVVSGIDGNAPVHRLDRVDQDFARRYVRTLKVLVDSPEVVADALPESIRPHMSRLPAGELPVCLQGIRKEDELMRVVRVAVAAG